MVDVNVSNVSVEKLPNCVSFLFRSKHNIVLRKVLTS